MTFAESARGRARVAPRAVLAVIVAVLTACSSADSGGPRPLSVEQASRLAEATFLNHRMETAAFEVNTIEGPGGATLRLSGVVDWKTSSGYAAVSSATPGATLTAIVWQSGMVLERRPVHDTLLSGLGAAVPAFLGRPADMSRRIDQVISVVSGLATRQPENAILLQQKEGTAFLRDDELRGRQVEVLRYGTRSIFWVDLEDGTLVRFEGSNAVGNQPIIVDFFPAAGKTVELPGRNQVVMVTGNDELSALLNTP